MVKSSKARILITGYKKSGKDTAAEYLTKYGYKFISASEYATIPIMIPYFESVGKIYSSPKECFDDRVSDGNRKIWFDVIENFNRNDGSALTRRIFDSGYDVYVGLRSLMEFTASRDLFDHVIWVDGTSRMPLEDISSCTITPDCATYVLDNNGSLKDLEKNIHEFFLKHLL